MRHFLLFIALFFSATFVAQDPAGTCLFIDYEAFQDDGILRYVDCGNNDIFNTGAELTVQCWTRINDTNWNQKIAGKTNGSFNSGYVFAIDQGDVYGEVWNPSLNEIHDGFIPPVQIWYHLAITFSAGDMMRGYVNGELVQEISVSGNDIATNADNFIIGIAPWDLSNFQTFGELDELIVLSEALTEEEIKDNMFKSMPGDNPGYVAYYTFDDGQGTTVSDVSTNGNEGTFVGLTDGDWAPSRAPIGDENIVDQNNVVGLWNGVTFSDPRFVITENGLSMSASGLDDLDYCVYGHNGSTGVNDDDLPVGAPTNFMQTGRTWYINEVGAMEATLTFNLINAAAGGELLDQSQPANHYTLLYRQDQSSEWQFLAQADELTGAIAIFEEFSLATGYYAIGVGEEPATITIGVEETNSIVWSFYPNPAGDELMVDLTGIQTGNVLVNISDATGKLVWHNMLQSGVNHQLDVTSLEAGSYILRVESAHGVSAKSLIIK